MVAIIQYEYGDLTHKRQVVFAQEGKK